MSKQVKQRTKQQASETDKNTQKKTAVRKPPKPGGRAKARAAVAKTKKGKSATAKLARPRVAKTKIAVDVVKAPRPRRPPIKMVPAVAPLPTMVAASAGPITSADISVLAYCRAGFEPDLLTEIMAHLAATPKASWALPGSGFVRATFAPAALKRLHMVLHEPMVFARQIMRAQSTVVALGSVDRVTPIVNAAKEFLTQLSIPNIAAVWVEYPDTNDGKSLSKLSMALQTRITQQLDEMGLVNAQAKRRLHVFLTSKGEAWLGLTDIEHSSSWPLGIPRLRMPADAPSRSTLKLAEAIHIFIGDDDERLFQPDMRAVDLGAAPGGWTWQLVHRGLYVTAIDNGNLRGELVDNAMVRHLREDGFKYRPNKPVDWMVCDMVESPSRIAKLVGLWLSEGWARHVIFNLKLPMKKRFEEVERCSAIIDEMLGDKAERAVLQLKQLYHDREEVTGYCGFPPRARQA